MKPASGAVVRTRNESEAGTFGWLRCPRTATRRDLRALTTTWRVQNAPFPCQPSPAETACMHKPARARPLPAFSLRKGRDRGRHRPCCAGVAQGLVSRRAGPGAVAACRSGPESWRISSFAASQTLLPAPDTPQTSPCTSLIPLALSPPSSLARAQHRCLLAPRCRASRTATTWCLSAARDPHVSLSSFLRQLEAVPQGSRKGRAGAEPVLLPERRRTKGTPAGHAGGSPATKIHGTARGGAANTESRGAAWGARKEESVGYAM